MAPLGRGAGATSGFSAPSAGRGTQAGAAKVAAMKRGSLPLSELRLRLRGESDARRLRRWRAILSADSRTGARSLAIICDERLERLRVDRRRVSRLFALRRKLLRDGAHAVAGVDEVGMGPLAGPVVAAAVVLPERVDLPGLRDSKQLTARARERLDADIREQARAVSIAEVDPQEIDLLNILRAGLEAMRRAVSQLPLRPDHLIVDARTVPGVSLPQTSLTHGDALDGSIAAASIVAKVYRDSLMRRLDGQYPGYGFAQHMGYPTASHVEALNVLGPSPVHRHSFAPVAAATRA